MAENKTNVYSAGLKLTALVDGTTIQGNLYSTKPLVQGFSDRNTEKAIPDFETESNRPTVYLVLNDISTGEIYAESEIQSIQWYYNGQPFSFDESGLCDDIKFKGLFQKATYNQNGKTVPGIKVMKNFPQFGKFDNDIISVDASIEINGSPIWVKDVNIPVVVQQMDGNVYSLQLTDTNGFRIPKDESINSTETTAELLIDGEAASESYISDHGVVFIWEEVLTGGVNEMARGKKLTVTKDDVGNVLIVRCRAVDNTQKELAVVYQNYTDLSDPYYITTEKTEKKSAQPLKGTTVRRGQIAVIKPKLVSRNSTAEYKGTVRWDFTAYNNNGKVYDGTGVEKAATYCEVTYDAIVAADMNMNIIIDATIGVK